MKQYASCDQKLPNGEFCGQVYRLDQKHQHIAWHKREERKYKAKLPFAPIMRSEEVTQGYVEQQLEQAMMYLDRGFLSALDRVATDLTKDTGDLWTRNSVLTLLRQ